MDSTTLLAVLGPLIALLVQFAKKIPFVAANPKVVAGVLALAATMVVAFVAGDVGVTIAALLQVAVDAFLATGSAVLSYEAMKRSNV